MKPASFKQIYIENPCSMDWDAMDGNERKRFCGGCKKHVHDFSKGTIEEFNKLWESSKGDICISIDDEQINQNLKYLRPAKGFFSRLKYHLSSICTVILLNILSIAEGKVDPRSYAPIEMVDAQELESEKYVKTLEDSVQVKGKVTDKEGRGISGASVELMDRNKKVLFKTETDSLGRFNFYIKENPAKHKMKLTVTNKLKKGIYLIISEKAVTIKKENYSAIVISMNVKKGKKVKRPLRRMGCPAF